MAKFRRWRSWCHVLRQQSQKRMRVALPPLLHLYPTQEKISSVPVAADRRANTGFTLREAREGLLQSMVEVWRAPFKPTHPISLWAILYRGLFYELLLVALIYEAAALALNCRLSQYMGGWIDEDQPGLGFCSKSSFWKEGMLGRE